MHNSKTLTRLGGTAIAAVLALTATPAFAQEATPQEVPQISVPDEPAASTTSTTTTTTTVETPAADPLAAEPVAAAPAPAATKVTTTRTTTTRPARPAASTARSAAPAAPVAATAAPAPAATEPLPAPLDAAPIAPLAAAPVAEPVATPETAVVADDAIMPIALGAGLGLLALGGAAFALTRRRRRDAVVEDAIVAEPTLRREAPIAPTPAVAAATTERSAFSWGQAAPAAAASTGGKSWIERAHRGPTPENPSLSLKKRLQRAAFYDQRERAVAAGKASPLSPVAGLPARFVEALRSRPAATTGYIHAYA